MQVKYTWASLGTTAGCSAAVLLVTQYVKDYLPRWAAGWRCGDRRFFSWRGPGFFARSDTPSRRRLPCWRHPVTIALAAMGAYETALKEKTQGKG